MEEQEVLKNKLIKHIIYNIIGFAVIFIVFGIFIFFLVKGVTFSSVIKDLYDSKKQILDIDNEILNNIKITITVNTVCIVSSLYLV